MVKKNSKRANKKINPLIQNKISAYIGSVQKRVPILKAYVFGSWTNGKPNRNSDIDVAVISKSFTDCDKTIQPLAKAMKQEWSPIEPHGFHPDDCEPTNPIVDEILKHGIRII